MLREDGTPCAPDEPGELVHRGALVGMGYWNDPEKTAERYKPLPGRASGLVLPEIAVFSGDTVRRDEEGFLYFIGRRDEMIKTSGYRVSPTEVEEVALRHAARRRVRGVRRRRIRRSARRSSWSPRPRAGERARRRARCSPRAASTCRPTWCPRASNVRTRPLPRNPNGKIDRKLLAGEFEHLFAAP